MALAVQKRLKSLLQTRIVLFSGNLLAKVRRGPSVVLGIGVGPRE
jgi:hypothetical protein